MKRIRIMTIALGTMAASLLSLSSCRSQQSETAQVREMSQQMIGSPLNYLPKAHIYRTDGDYFDKVPISVSADGKSVTSFPAPSDLTEHSMPVRLDGGWLLDRRGIGTSTVFTRYTYAEYMKLKQAPSVQELLEAVIPGSKVSDLVELPLGMSEADASPSLCNHYIKDGFKDCKILIP